MVGAVFEITKGTRVLTSEYSPTLRTLYVNAPTRRDRPFSVCFVCFMRGSPRNTLPPEETAGGVAGIVTSTVYTTMAI